MKEHFCPVEQSIITYQDKCNWCGEIEGGIIETIKDILTGIDQTEIESSNGWWETSTGAKFGAEKLKQIVKVLAQTDQDEDAIIIQYHEATIKRLEKRIEELLAQTQEPVAWLEPEWGEKICPEVGYEVTMTDDHPRDLCWIPLYAHPPQNTNETDEEIKSKCPRTDSIWSLGWYEGYKACNKNTAQAYLKGFDEGCKSMSAKNKTENIGCLGMPVNVPVTPPQRTWVGLTDEEIHDIVWSLPYEPSQEHIRAIEDRLKEKNNA